MPNHSSENRIDYIELPALNITKTKQFFSDVFGWKFVDYGPDYTSFDDGNLTGGFYKTSAIQKGGTLIVIYSTQLEPMQSKIVKAGGQIIRPTFEFPGGKRFHFSDPNGNELAVWSDH